MSANNKYILVALQTILRDKGIFVWVFRAPFSNEFSVRVETDIYEGKTYNGFSTWDLALKKGIKEGKKLIK